MGPGRPGPPGGAPEQRCASQGQARPQGQGQGRCPALTGPRSGSQAGPDPHEGVSAPPHRLPAAQVRPVLTRPPARAGEGRQVPQVKNRGVTAERWPGLQTTPDLGRAWTLARRCPRPRPPRPLGRGGEARLRGVPPGKRREGDRGGWGKWFSCESRRDTSCHPGGWGGGKRAQPSARASSAESKQQSET